MPDKSNAKWDAARKSLGGITTADRIKKALEDQMKRKTRKLNALEEIMGGAFEPLSIWKPRGDVNPKGESTNAKDKDGSDNKSGSRS